MLAFQALPGATDLTLRPMVPVFVGGIELTPMTALVDTGSLHNRFATWIAEEAGIELGDIRPTSIGVGGRPTLARTVVTTLRVGPHEWEAPVSFCDPWPWDFQLLGQEGFLRWFRVVIEAADRRLEITPV